MEGSQHDIILGMPFLKQENPTIDWLRRTIGLRATDGRATDIHAASATIKKKPTIASRSSIRRAARTAGAVVAVVHVTVDEEGAQMADAAPPPPSTSKPNQALGSEGRENRILHDFKDTFRTSLPDHPPPEREVDHRIDLVEGATPVARPYYRLSYFGLRAGSSTATRSRRRAPHRRI